MGMTCVACLPQVQGFWYALLAAFALQAVIMCVTVTCVIDFDKEARKAQVRMLERAGSSAAGAVAAHGSTTSADARIGGVEEPLLGAEREAE
jgi:hypothetical protein